MNDSAISVKGLRKAFGRRKVLEGLDLKAARGEVVGVLGRNGSGKTTLFRILLDLTAADAGEVAVLGRRPDGRGAIRGLVGYVPEKPVFHPFMTVRGVLQFRARFFPAWDAAKAEDLMKRLELDPDAKAGSLSKGGAAKLAWVCAAAHGPELFLLDEPTSGLDYLVRDHILNGLVNELAEGGRTILVSDHRMGELGGLLDRVCVLKGGRIAADHSADFLKTQAFRVSVRADRTPASPGVREIGRSGPVAELAVFGKDELGRLQAELGGAAQVAPLGLDEAFKALLGEI